MRRLAIALLLLGTAHADPLLDKSRNYYTSLKSYQVKVHCKIYKGLAQGQPFVDTVTQISAALPNKLRMDAKVTVDGELSRQLHIFDGKWQWIETDGTKTKLSLARLTQPDQPFATGTGVSSAGLVDGTDLVGTMLGVLEEGGLERTGPIQIGKFACQTYTVSGERYEGDNKVSLYLDAQGILRGYKEVDWDDSGKELTAIVTLENFRPGVKLPSSTFTVTAPAKYKDKTAWALQKAQIEAKDSTESQLWQFAKALRGDDLRNAKRLVKKSPALIKARFAEHKQTPLHLAAGRPHLVEWLLAQGADPTLLDSNGFAPANLSRSLREWQLFAAKGVDFKALQAQCMPLMITAFRAQDPAMVEFLQAQGVTGPLVMPDGWSVLHEAASSSKPEVLVPLALELGEASNQPDIGTPTPFQLLLTGGSAGADRAIQALKARGLDLDSPIHGPQPLSVLMDAVQKEEVDRVERVLALGANPNRMHGGASAMHDAAVAGDPRLLGLLLAARGNPNLAGELGWTPLHCASYWGRDGHVQLLLQAGADPNSLDQHGNTPLHLAASEGHEALYRRLLEAGASADRANQQGQTPAQILALKKAVPSRVGE